MAEEIFNTIKKVPELKKLLKEYKDTKDFSQWINTEDTEFLLSDICTAIHESVHAFREKTGNNYRTIDGLLIKALDDYDEKLPAPSIIYNKLPASLKDEYSYASAYLNPSKKDVASSAHHFSYLMDEFNAYVHDTYFAKDLEEAFGDKFSSTVKDGTYAMMTYLVLYLKEIRDNNAITWKLVQRTPDIKNAIVGLWETAERALEKSSGMDHITIEKEAYLNVIAKNANAINKLLGREIKVDY